MRRLFLSIAAFAALLLVGVTAVQGQSSPSGSATPSACASPMASPESSPMATATEAMGSPMAGTPSAANCGGQAGPSVQMVDINFSPKQITIPANTDVKIMLTNAGSTVHNFNIDELNIHSGDYQPDQTGTVTVNAKPGDYTYYCNIPGHEAAGMSGTLHVK